MIQPKSLSPKDAARVISHAISRLGSSYDVRHLLDLARFFFPWAVLPRRWRSSLFEHNAGAPTRTVCSSLLAEAFNAVDFPILPFIDRRVDGSLRFFKRNPRLFTPKDFDYSPYFDIIKYPFLGLDDLGIYRKLPWADSELIYNDEHSFETELPDEPDESGMEVEQNIVSMLKAPKKASEHETMPEPAEQQQELESSLLRIFRRVPRFPFLKRGG